MKVKLMLRIRDLYNITFVPIYWRTSVWKIMFLDELISRKLITLYVYTNIVLNLPFIRISIVEHILYNRRRRKKNRDLQRRGERGGGNDFRTELTPPPTWERNNLIIIMIVYISLV